MTIVTLRCTGFVLGPPESLQTMKSSSAPLIEVVRKGKRKKEESYQLIIILILAHVKYTMYYQTFVTLTIR